MVLADVGTNSINNRIGYSTKDKIEMQSPIAENTEGEKATVKDKEVFATSWLRNLFKRNDFRKRVVLITGASTGLGLALTKELLESGSFHVIATARRSSLHRFEDEGVFETKNLWIRPLNVLSKNERDSIIHEATEKLGGIDVLVNNAGYCLRGVVEQVNETERLKQIDTNFRAPMALIRGVLPHMRKKRAGHIINISSVSGMMAMPTMSIYSASKFALEGATEALWYEVRPWNIKVCLIQPGFINSDSFRNVELTRESRKSIQDKNNPYYYHYNSMAPFIAKMMRLSPSTPEKIAKKIHMIINSNHPPLRVPVTIDAYFFGLLRKLLPQKIYNGLMYYSLPRVFRWGEDDHYYMDAEYEQLETQKEKEMGDTNLLLLAKKRKQRLSGARVGAESISS